MRRLLQSSVYVPHVDKTGALPRLHDVPSTGLKVFPIDQRDIDEVKISGGQCGYRFQ